MQKGERKSESTVALVTIKSKDDYTDCISSSEELSFDTLSYDFDGQNRTIYLDMG